MTHIVRQEAGPAAAPAQQQRTGAGEAAGSLSPKAEYRAFCREEASLHLFVRDWWLDAAVGAEGWDVALVKHKNKVVASMPYVRRSRCGLSMLTQPAMTPVLGPWLRQNPGKLSTQIGVEMELMQALIDQLPPFDYFAQTWHSSTTNWQPFFWNGFQQTTFYSYVLPELSDSATLWAGLETNMRRIITKAGKEHRLQVRDDLPLDVFLELHSKTFERQGLALPFPDAFVRRIDAACAERGCRKYFISVDPDGVPHAGCYIVWDQHSAYGMMQGSDPSLRASGGNSLAMWASIQFAAGVTRQYNFSGSMIAPIERYLRDFGGQRVPYFHISKTTSRMLKLRQGVLSLIGKK